MDIADIATMVLAKVFADRTTSNMGLKGTLIKGAVGYFLLKQKNKHAKNAGVGVMIDAFEDLAVMFTSNINFNLASNTNRLNVI